MSGQDVSTALACLTINPRREETTSTSLYDHSAPFPFRDLPEELQLHIITLSLPTWSLHLVRWAHHVCKAEAATHKQELRYIARRSNIFSPSLFLVDKHMKSQMRKAAKSAFTGQLYTEYLAAESKSWKLNSDCTCLLAKHRHQAKKHILRHNLDQITVVNCWTSGFANFDRDLFKVLPNLRAVVASYRKQLFDGYIYGFGSEELLIRHVSDASITKLVMPQLTTYVQMRILQELWTATIAPVVELQVDVGRSTMSFSFVAVCVVSRAEDGQAETKILQRYSMREWQVMDDREKVRVYSLIDIA